MIEQFLFIQLIEVDLIILNKQTRDVFLFEIKHSSKVDNEQTKHLESEQFINYIKDNFGSKRTNCSI